MLILTITLTIQAASSHDATISGMNTPAVTPAQYGAGGLFAAVALACITTGITGVDLIAYLASSSLVTAALVVADMGIRKGRAENATDIARATRIAGDA